MYNSLLFLSASSPGKICEQSQSLVIKGSVCLWLSPAGMGTLLVKHQDGQSKRTRQERTETSLLWFWANFVRSCPQGNAQTETQQFPAVFFHPALRWDSSRTVHLGLFHLSCDPPSATDQSVEFSQDFCTSLWASVICTCPNTTYVTMLRVQTLLGLGSVKVLWYLVVADTSGNAAEAQTLYFKRCGMRYNKSFSFHFPNPH